MWWLCRWNLILEGFRKIIMFYLFNIPFAIAYAFLNRARGSKLFGYTNSTTVARMVSMSGMAFLTTFRYLPGTALEFVELFSGCLALLMLWCAPAWDSYWSAAIGNEPLQNRLSGTLKMSVRMSLILLYYAFVVWFTGAPIWHMVYATSFLLMGITYYFSGLYTPGVNVIRNPELANGGIIGAITFLIGI